MASYRPFLSQSSFGPPANQNTVPPPPPPPSTSQHSAQQPGSQYIQNWGYGGGDAMSSAPSSFSHDYNQMQSNSNFHNSNYGSSRTQHPPQPPQQQYSYPPPPPPPESSYQQPPPPPPSASQSSMSVPQRQQPPIYYPSSQYSQYNNQPPPPPLPPLSPPGSSVPPPPPPSSPPPPPHGKESGLDRKPHRDKVAHRERELGHSNRGLSSKLQKPPVPPVPMKKPNGPSGRVETEEERRLRKKREYEKLRQEEKHRHQLKESQNTLLQKTQMLSSGRGHGSVVGSRMGERRSTPLLSGERIENRLKKPTTFLCKLKFRNELPDPSAQPKLMALKRDIDQYTKYRITSLEKNYKPELYVEPDLGIPLDLLDLSVYNPPSIRRPLDPEDEELLRDDEVATPVKKDGIKRKERPTDKGMSWLVKTQYISPLSMESAKQSLTEKQAKELREMRGGRNILDNVNNRGRQIKEIEASFEASKLRPVHATNKDLYPVEIMPLLPDFDRDDDKFVVAAFDNAPTADSEIYSKFDQSVRDAHEAKAIIKSYVTTGSDPAKTEKFLAYMVPSPHELSKDIYDEHEDVSYSWIREYNWDVRGDDAEDPTTFLVSFDEAAARYVPLPTKLMLRKKRATEGRSGDEMEHFPVPSRVTVRRRSTANTIEHKDSGGYSNSKGKSEQEMDQYSDADDDMSD